ncbi:putative nuclease HARBI1 [Merluccius polli]|uniref:Nuclease HARBI1 n=1 Tax=Merluccius polli TaxID=89951 RepID=A0AA47N1Q6_MERPO|nr:putative nuclease HARBI1 [Merluccius polli]
MAARRNVLETMEDCELIKRYRLNREGIQLVVELVWDAITSPTNRNNPISPEIKCLATLRYLATGKMQLCNADDLGISQPSFIRFPLDNQQLHRIKANFMAIAGMPGVVGAIDGTHIQIIAPSKDEDVFVNRKKVHSINTQIVFDATFNLLDVVAKWPGSTHDPRILIESGLRREAPGTSWSTQKYTKCCGERNWQMKRRFHVLHGKIRLSPERASTVITVCAILHNRYGLLFKVLKCWRYAHWIIVCRVLLIASLI